MEFWNQKTFCLVTGASQGIGKTIAIEFSKKVGPDSVFLLVARSASGLEETKSEILAVAAPHKPIQVMTAAVDLGKPDAKEYLSMINAALSTSGTQASDFEHSLLVHNAGSVGSVERGVTQLEDLDELRQYFGFNVFSMILLNSQFFKVFDDPGTQRSVVQLSSLAGIMPFKTLGLYCAGKAARDMLMRSIAEEEPSISTISYAPGPCDTDMFAHCMNNSADADTEKMFREVVAAGKLLTTLQTVTLLIKILGEKKYTKGEHVDFSQFE